MSSDLLDWTLDIGKHVIENLMFTQKDDYKIYLQAFMQQEEGEDNIYDMLNPSKLIDG